MTYDINTLPQNELLKFLLAVKEHYNVDAIDEQKAKTEIEHQEKALSRRKQLENEIARNGYSREELLDVIVLIFALFILISFLLLTWQLISSSFSRF